jgi:ribonucleoside-diphosphate reductase alpha chain
LLCFTQGIPRRGAKENDVTSGKVTIALEATRADDMKSSPNLQILERFAGPSETWSDLLDRVSAVGQTRVRPEYRRLLASGMLVPGGQILRGAGRPGSVLYNCFVTGVSDGESVDSLAARVSRWTRLGAGVGVNVDSLLMRERAQGNSVQNVIDRIARSQQTLWNEGFTRTATMVTLSLGDIEVVDAARLLTSAEHYRHLNIGVLVKDGDMEARSPVLDELADVAWSTGNPGFLFIDRVRRDHPFEDPVRACNPCGEQFLADEEGCNLASLNLAAFVHGESFDWDAFEAAIALAVRFLDDVIDASSFPSGRAAEMARRRRRIGLGVLGFASLLQRLKVDYGSDDSVALAEMIASALRRAAEAATKMLAAERGPFPDTLNGQRRNSHLLSIAPTGAISLLWNVSSGIEPFFGEAIKKGSMTVAFDRGNGKRPPRGDEVTPYDHVRVLGAWQRHVDGGISKTISLHHTARVDDVRAAITDAWREGCKGVSLFRDGCRAPAIKVVEATVA